MPAATRAPMQYVRVEGGPYIDEIAHLCILLLYLKATRLAIDDVAMSCSHQLAILLTMLLVGPHVSCFKPPAHL